MSVSVGVCTDEVTASPFMSAGGDRSFNGALLVLDIVTKLRELFSIEVDAKNVLFLAGLSRSLDVDDMGSRDGLRFSGDD